MTAHERQVFFADDVSIVSGDNSVQEYEEKYTDVVLKLYLRSEM